MAGVALRPWADGDRWLLVAANSPEMTAFLGGPETEAELDERQERYLRLDRDGVARMSVVERDGEPVGAIGWWTIEHHGSAAAETGWFTLPGRQGTGVAHAALALVVEDAVAHGTASVLYAFPAVENAPSNGVCRGAGFTLEGGEDLPFRGATLHVNVWALDLAARRVTGG